MNQPQVELPDVDLPRVEKPRCYYVPRRFNLRAMMVLTAVIAAVCALLQRFHTPPLVYIWLAVMSSIAACAQVFFPKNPRMASTIVAGNFHGLIAICFVGWEVIENWNDPMAAFAFLAVCINASYFVVSGFFLGYAFGTLTAGVFMISDWFSPTSMFNQDETPHPTQKPPR